MKQKFIFLLLCLGALCLAAGSAFTESALPTVTPTPFPETEPGEIIEGWNPAGVDPDDTTRRGTMIPGYGSAVMNEGEDTLRLTIGNPLGNRVGFFAVLMLEDGTELYSSPLLEPGQAVPLVPLSETLKAGKYLAQVVYNCVTLDQKHTPLNGGVSGFTLNVN